MRTTKAATSDVANQQGEPKVFWDTQFRDSKSRIVAPPKLDCPVADTHVHLDMLHHPALAIARSAAQGVDFLVTVVDPSEDPRYTYHNLAEWQRQARDLLDEWNVPVPVPRIRVIIGCHPHNAAKFNRDIERFLIIGASQQVTAGIGEIGLDYHYDLSPRAQQREVFKRQLALAHTMMLPVSLHLREAHQEGLQILKEEGVPLPGVLLHCFNLDFETLKPFLDLGCYVAFGGSLTFKKCDELRQAARQTPPQRIVTETDAPFMAPEPLRGTVCGPEDTVFTAARLVEVFDVEGRKAIQLLTRFYENARNFLDRDTSSWQDNAKAVQALLAQAQGVVAAAVGDAVADAATGEAAAMAGERAATGDATGEGAATEDERAACEAAAQEKQADATKKE